MPAEVRKKLGVGPGSILEWEERNDEVVVRRAGQHTSGDVHKALFPDGKLRKGSPQRTRESIRKYIRQKHARR